MVKWRRRGSLDWAFGDQHSTPNADSTSHRTSEIVGSPAVYGQRNGTILRVESRTRQEKTKGTSVAAEEGLRATVGRAAVDAQWPRGTDSVARVVETASRNVKAT